MVPGEGLEPPSSFDTAYKTVAVATEPTRHYLVPMVGFEPTMYVVGGFKSPAVRHCATSALVINFGTLLMNA